ncbi:MAG: TIR domain-containing protein [Nonomuraea sp.]|nr:TIR domain-containing protein [Nonomuraea sp.]
MEIDRLRTLLGDLGMAATGPEVAEVLWLAAHISAEIAGEPVAERPEAGHDGPAAEPADRPDKPRAAPDPQEEATEQARHELHAPSAEASQGRGAADVLVPTAPMLNHPLAVQRALRPLKRRVPSRTAVALDEDATAARIALQPRGTRPWVPVLTAEPERWLSLLLVVDTGPAMRLWKPLARELYDTLLQIGAFRDLRTCHLSGEGVSARPGAPPRDAATCLDPSGRQVVLVLSDCSGPHWWDGRVGRTLELWARNGPTAILQPLAERLWRRTAAPAVPGTAGAGHPCAPNVALRFEAFDGAAVPGVVPVPVLECAPNWLADWAHLVSGAGGPRPVAMTYVDDRRSRGSAVAGEQALPIRERVHRFQATASPQAVRLAGHAAVSFPALPVLRLIQQNILGGDHPGQLAEVLLSGLLRPAEFSEDEFDFVPGAREALLGTLPRSESWHTADVLERVSKEIERRGGSTGELFRASIPVPEGDRRLAGGSRRFGLVSPEALRLLRPGGAVQRSGDATVSEVRRPGSGVLEVAFSPDGRSLATAMERGPAVVWDLMTGAVIRTFGDGNDMSAVTWSPDGTTLATGGENGEVRLWDPVTGTVARTVAGTGAVSALAWTPDVLAVGGEHGVRLSVTGTVTAALEPAGDVSALAWSPDGTTLACGAGTDLLLHFMGSRGLQPLHHGADVNAVAWTPDGDAVLAGDATGAVTSWDPSASEATVVMEGQGEAVLALAWSPDGSALVAGGAGRALRLWRPGTGEIFRVPHGHDGAVRTVAWSPDGRTVATGGDDGLVRLWDPAPTQGLIYISHAAADEHWAIWLAWQLQEAGHRTRLQAQDYVPGSNFIDFVDRGISEAAIVVALLSEGYLRSRYGQMEWQAALRSSPDDSNPKLVTIRVEACEPTGLLGTIAWTDLVGVQDEYRARQSVLARIGEALARQAESPEPAVLRELRTLPRSPGDRRLPNAPPFPSSSGTGRTRRKTVTVLHVTGPRFGRPADPSTAEDVRDRIRADVAAMRENGAPQPDLLVVTGNLTASGTRGAFAMALEFLHGLRLLLGLGPERVVVVPGAGDVTLAACQAYFATCEAEEVPPQPPYWPKWRHYAGMFAELYQGLDDVVFDSAQPWTLFTVPELKVAVAGINTTMAFTHRPEDQYGMVGADQAAWFGERLGLFEREGWLRLAVSEHGLAHASLADGSMAEEHFGHRLNAVLHDQDGDPDTLSSGAISLPGRLQLLEFSDDGLTVHLPGAGPRPIARRWSSAHNTFGGDPAGTSPTVIEPADQTALETLLQLITDVCEARYENARVRRFAGDPPRLLVTRHEQGIVRRSWIGAVAGEPTADDVDDLLGHVHAGADRSDPELVYLGPAPPRRLREDALRRGLRVRSLTEFQGLLDLSGYAAAHAERLTADPAYAPSLYVPQRFRDVDRPERGAGDDLAAELLRLLAADQGTFVLVLGESGLGKTFLLREVVRRAATELPHLIPILIDLRSLDAARSVDALVAAHLANAGEDVIDLKALRYMLRNGRIVLLFDGFDELVTRISYDNAADHLGTLLDAAEDRAKVVVTGRTQHFKSQAQIRTALGERVGVLPRRRLLSIEPFDWGQTRAYLRNRYGDRTSVDERLRLLSSAGDLTWLSGNPGLLGSISDLSDDRLRALTEAGPSGLYTEVLSRWINGEALRTDSRPGQATGLSGAGLWNALETLALRSWESGTSSLSLGQLTEVARTLARMADGRLTADHAAHVIGSASLLTRTEDGRFGFFHRSIAEWLVARHIAGEFAAGDPAPQALSRRPLSALAADFLGDLCTVPACREWAERTLADSTAADIPRGNARLLASRLR